MEKKFLVEFIVLVIVLVIILAVSNLQASVTSIKGKIEEISWDRMEFKKDLSADVQYLEIPTSQMTEYTVKVHLDIEYHGNLSDEVNIKPVIEFQGKSAEAALISIDPKNKDTLKFQSSVEANIISEIPITKEYNNDYMVEGQKVKKGNYLITLTSLSISLLEKIVDPLSPTCKIEFSVEDEKNLKKITFKDEGETAAYFGNGEVTIIVKKDNVDDCRRVKAEIISTGGEQWDIMEKASISFWKFTDCTRDLKTFDRLSKKCPDDFLGGRNVEIPLTNFKKIL